jgi:hypothetical protein
MAFFTGASQSEINRRCSSELRESIFFFLTFGILNVIGCGMTPSERQNLSSVRIPRALSLSVQSLLSEFPVRPGMYEPH